jgi:quercetin dioxygenase-like cupin family protein
VLVMRRWQFMETKMVRLVFLVLALLGGGDRLAAQEKVEMRGITAAVKLEETIFGHLTELNGKYKLRATEVTFAPGGFLGVHHHVGPGIRYVISGEVTFTEGGHATTYRAGDYFFETGNLAHTAENRSSQPLRILFLEILPKDWAAPTVIPAKAN